MLSHALLTNILLIVACENFICLLPAIFRERFGDVPHHKVVSPKTQWFNSIRTYTHQGADHEIFSTVGEISFLAGLKTFLLGSIWTKFTKWTHEFEESQSALGAIELSRQVGAEMDLLKSGVCFSLILIPLLIHCRNIWYEFKFFK